MILLYVFFSWSFLCCLCYDHSIQILSKVSFPELVMLCLMNCDLVFLESWYVCWIMILCFLNYDPVQALNKVEWFYCMFFYCAVYVMTIPFKFYQRFHFLILWCCVSWIVILCFLNHDMFVELGSCVSSIMILSKLLTTSNDFTVSFCFLGVCCAVYVMTIPFTFYQRFHFLILWSCVWWIVILCFLNHDMLVELWSCVS